MHPARLWPGHRHGERAMIVVHHLNNSRSQRILWLLEELSLPYEIRFYQRDPVTNLAPPELEAVHPLGKSPVITDGAVTIAESGAIIDYILRKYGAGRLAPAPDAADYEAYLEWLHYAEGSAMLPLMLLLYTMRVGEAARAFGRLGDFPDIAAWVERLHARTAFKAALERGGAYNLA